MTQWLIISKISSTQTKNKYKTILPIPLLYFFVYTLNVIGKILNKKSMAKFMRYFATACIGLSLDFVIFVIASHILSAAASHAIGYSVGMISTFVLQKHFVFNSNRKTHHAFGLALILWLIGLGLSTLLIDFLAGISYLSTHLMIAKIITTGFTFWYNFFTRKFAFKD